MSRLGRSASRTTAVRIAEAWPSETSAARLTASGRTERTRKIMVAPRTDTGRKDLTTVDAETCAFGRAAARPGVIPTAAMSRPTADPTAMRGNHAVVTLRPSDDPRYPLKPSGPGPRHAFTRLDSWPM